MSPKESSRDDRQSTFDFMTSKASHGVRESNVTDRNEIAYAIGRAFFDDPIAIYLFPEEKARRTGFGVFAKLAMDQFRATGATFVTEPVRGAAIWQAPSPPALNLWQQTALAFRLLLVMRGGYQRAIQLSETMEKHHLSEPHWYLAILGIDPEDQGRGLGSALLAPSLARCDHEGTIAYLESSKESNIPFYQNHGFAVSREIRIPNGPVVWSMIRPPA